jgi:hypothetical protein
MPMIGHAKGRQLGPMSLDGIQDYIVHSSQSARISSTARFPLRFHPKQVGGRTKELFFSLSHLLESNNLFQGVFLSLHRLSPRELKRRT